ncbi:MAG: type II/IV secretion system protein [Planctomycetes bacterium]|nr:type II/IV secretion system protein [Planctomycetota bacterium]
MPTRFGERLTLRLLMVQSERLTLTNLGFVDADLLRFRGAIRAPHGMVLLTGPTGSGKTTTLYAGLRTLDLGRVNVLTIEDPIEYEIDGIAQIEVEGDDRITFPRALRSALRHDPDVMMIGEIRDLETAEIAVRASLTGHLVLSTLHTNSAAGAIARLVDMGVPSYLIGATLRLAVAQRLVRRLCRHCRRPRAATAAEADAFGWTGDGSTTVFDPVGCAYCKRTGFAGRIGVFELFAPDPATVAEIAAGADQDEVLRRSRAAGRSSTLRADAARKVQNGSTSPSEAMLALEAG